MSESYKYRSPSPFTKGKRIIDGKKMVWSTTLRRWNVQYKPSTWRRDQPPEENNSNFPSRSRPAPNTYAAMDAPLASARNPHNMTNERTSSVHPNQNPRRGQNRDLMATNQLTTARSTLRDAPRLSSAPKNQHGLGRTGNTQIQQRAHANGNARVVLRLSACENQHPSGQTRNSRILQSNTRDPPQLPAGGNQHTSGPTESNQMQGRNLASGNARHLPRLSAPETQHGSGQTKSNQRQEQTLASGDASASPGLSSACDSHHNSGQTESNQTQERTMPCSRDTTSPSNQQRQSSPSTNDVEAKSRDSRMPDVINFQENDALTVSQVTDQESTFAPDSQSIESFENKVYQLNKEMASIEDQIKDEKRLIDEHSSKVFIHSRNVEKLRKQRKRVRRSLTEAKKIEISQMLKRVAELEQEVKDADGSGSSSESISPQNIPSIPPVVVYKQDSGKKPKEDESDDEVTFLKVVPSSSESKRSHPSDDERSIDSSKRPATRRRQPTCNDIHGSLDV